MFSKRLIRRIHTKNFKYIHSVLTCTNGVPNFLICGGGANGKDPKLATQASLRKPLNLQINNDVLVSACFEFEL